MENQHQRIKGYRDLSQQEIDLMNEVKEHAEKTKLLVDKVWNAVQESQSEIRKEDSSFWEEDSHRWCWLGRDHLQQGYMSLIRAIAKPQSF